MERDAGREVLDAQQRIRGWEANKHKYLHNTEWWRDFYLSPGHANTKDEARELIRKAADKISAEELEARKQTVERAKRRDAVNRSPEARASRRADCLRLLSLNLGHTGVAYLLLYLPVLVSRPGRFPTLDLLWPVALIGAPLCYIIAFVSTVRVTSLWEKAHVSRARLTED